MNCVWITPEASGGIYSYSRMLEHALKKRADEFGFHRFESLYGDLKEKTFVQSLDETLTRLNPTLIHIQHEYGIFGGKMPPGYFFPTWLRNLKKKFPNTQIALTAHTVLPENFQFPVAASQPLSSRLMRQALNQMGMKPLKKLWFQDTFSSLDLILVHSRYQAEQLSQQGFKQTREVAHFVPSTKNDPAEDEIFEVKFPFEENSEIVTVFGYFSEDKGQDVAIQALSWLPDRAVLILAGGVRRPEDELYFKKCERLVKTLGIEKRVFFAGYIPDSQLNSLYEKSKLVLIPFRSTSGSGSLAQAISRGAAIVASDLKLNQEINERVSDAIEFFHTEDARSAAAQISRVLDSKEKRDSLRDHAQRYALLFSPEETAKKHFEVYREILKIR